MKALITGASSGIGREMAKYLDKKGISLVVAARRYDRLEKLKNELSGSCEIVTADLTDEKSCYEIFSKHPDIDILINNAGFGVFGAFDKSSLERELDMINVNICAMHILTKLYLKKFKEKNSGYILNVSSSASFFPGPLFASYYASKAYVTRLTQAVSAELKKEKSNVKISALCPGPVKTEFNDVAGVKFGVGSLEPDYVAKYAIDRMFRGRTVIVPGVFIKLTHVLGKIAPSKISTKFVYKIQKSKVGK